jgi:EmrB/QacA subfamily drug resistance transporter
VPFSGEKVQQSTGSRWGIDYKYLVVAVFIGGQFMNQIDSTGLNVALPVLGEQLHAGTDKLEWVATGYLLRVAVWVPIAGWLGDRFGTKRVLIFSLGIFTLGSLLCAEANSINELIAFRVIQGIGGGMIIPVGTAILFRAYPPAERAKAAVFFAIPTLIAPMLGPVFGGWLVDNASWRWIFYINLPVGAIVTLMAALVLVEHKEENSGKFDIAGFVLSGGSLALILFSISRAPRHGWTSAGVVLPLIVGAVLFVAMIYVEMNKEEPMLKLRLFANRLFRSTTVAWFMATAGLLGMLFLLPLYLQQLRGFSALETGLTTLPQGLGMALSLQFTSRVYPYIGPRRMMAFGMFGVAMTTLAFITVDLNTSLYWIGFLLFLRGISMAFAMVSNQAATFATIESSDLGRASSLSNTSLRIASAVGVAVLATVLTDRMGAHAGESGGADLATLHAFHDAFFVAFVLGLVGFLFALRIPDQDVAHLMKKRGAQPSRTQPETTEAPAIAGEL